MTFRARLAGEPWSVDFFAALRELERSAKGKPRIGDSTVPAEEIVQLGQDPYVEFPASNVSTFVETASGVPRLLSRFLGFFGPQGALPLNTTMEAFHWAQRGDPSFARFTDIFASRFLQLFFRAWADSRPIAHHDRPDADRFFRYVGAFAGFGVDSFRDRDSVEDLSKAAYAGLVGSKVKSASRLKRLVRGVFGVDVSIEERTGSWLLFEPADRLALGASGSTLGMDTFLGGGVYSINDKICVVIKARDLAEYKKFLPSGSMSDQLTDLIFFDIGHRFEFDVKLSLPARCAPATRLGVSGELGWTSWIAPDISAPGEVYLDDARFNVLERRRARQAEGRGTRQTTAGGVA